MSDAATAAPVYENMSGAQASATAAADDAMKVSAYMVMTVSECELN